MTNLPSSLLPPDIYTAEHAAHDARNLFRLAPSRAMWGDYYSNRETMLAARAELLKAATALGITHKAIRPTEEGRLCVAGKEGIIRYQHDTLCKLILAKPTKRAWRAAVDLLMGAMQVRLNCDYEGVFVFNYDNLRVVEIATTIRRLGKFRASFSPERLAVLAATGAAHLHQTPEKTADAE